jgi:hypothetical protein
MNKFSGPDDPDYKLVAGALKDILANPSPLNEADKWIREEGYDDRRLQIERLSGDLLAMDRCYINLSIINTRYTAMETTRSPDVSLFSRLKVDTTERSGQVHLPEIFAQSGGRRRGPRRIFIQGEAGVGKTTLCKKIVHDFKRQILWSNLFDRVLWIPLRKLKNRRGSGYGLKDLLIDEYFSQHRRGQLYAEVMQGVIDDVSDTRTLFLLDGLDEVAQHLDQNDDMSGCLRGLLNQQNVIITSRPFGLGSASSDIRPVDLRLETIGFHPQQVTQYIATAFPEDKDTAEQIEMFLKGHQIIQGLVRIPIQLDALCYAWKDGSFSAYGAKNMTSMYRIIEQSLWKKDVLRMEKEHEGRPLRACDIHDAAPFEIEGYVSREARFLDFFAFSGMYNGIIEFSTTHRHAIYQEFLEGCEGGKLLLPNLFRRLSFLRVSNADIADSGHRNEHESHDDTSDGHASNYHFLHLTYQEYFAARYIARQWKARQPLRCLALAVNAVATRSGWTDRAVRELEPAALVQERKYRAQYDVLWRFLAGLLGRGEELVEFFGAIEAEPLDLLGPTHQRLMLHCLSECSVDAGETTQQISQELLSIKTMTEERLQRWLQLGCRLTGRASLGVDVDFPDSILIAVFQCSNHDVKVAITRSLATHRTCSPAVGHLLASWLVEYWRSMIMHRETTKRDEAVAAILTTLSNTTHVTTLEDNALEMIAGNFLPRLWDPDYKYFRRSDDELTVERVAIKILRSQSSLPDRIREKLADATAPRHLFKWPCLYSWMDPKDLEADIRKLLRKEDDAALLVDYEAPTGKALEILVDLLGKDNDWEIQSKVYGLLRQQRTLPDRTVRAIVTWLTHYSSRVRAVALLALTNKSRLPEGVLDSVVKLLQNDDEDAEVKKDALGVLASQKAPSAAEIIVSIVNNKSESRQVRWRALRALTEQKALSQHLIEAVATSDSSYIFNASTARATALRYGREGTPLADSDIASVKMQILCAQTKPVSHQVLDSVDSWIVTDSTTLYALRRHPDLPVSFLGKVLHGIKDINFASSDPHWAGDATRSQLFEVLASQTQLPPDILQGMAELVSRAVEGGSFAEAAWDILAVIEKQPQIPEWIQERVLECLLPLMRNADHRYRVDALLRTNLRLYRGFIHREGMQTAFYKVWLRRSFDEQLSLCRTDDGGLCLSMPEGQVLMEREAGILIMKARETALGALAC